jgi:hypothetical protein
MIRDLYQMYTETVSFYQSRRNTGLWQKIKKRMKRKAAWNILIVLVFLGFTSFLHFSVRPVPLQSWGILLVGIGAIRLASISARVHMREFYDSSQNPKAIDERETTNYRPQVAGRMVDAFIGFALVAIGFTMRVSAEFL